MDQVEYYNKFGRLYRQSIINCPNPELWTTDFEEQGRVYLEMKERLGVQQSLINKYFKKDLPVLDIGCGFGRQASWLAKQGYHVFGTDSSEVFINIAKEIFDKNGYAGEFTASTILDYNPPQLFRQVMMLDVMEHIEPGKRKESIRHVSSFLAEGGLLLVSLPHVRNRISSVINNRIVRRIASRFSFYRKREEHPYPIPGKKEVLKLLTCYFNLEEFMGTENTDYYIFRRS